MAETTGRDKFSPLFIHGHCGLGKTHLLQGLATRFSELHPHTVVKYLTAEDFTNEYVTAVRNNRVDEFRRIYRGVDLLCLDDAHFLSSKEKTQTELLHTFDAIDLGGAKIVLASDDHPRDIKKMSEQLISRFLAGAVVRLDPPDEATREKIVRHLAQRRGLPMEDAAVQLLSDRAGRCGPGGTPGSVRDIEGMLTQVEAYFRLVPETAVSGTIGVVLVRRALNLGDSEGRADVPRSRRPIQVDRINTEVCRTLGVTVQEMMGIGRHPKVVLARSVIALLARRLTTLSFPEIARQMGRPNHSTVITAQKRLAAIMEENRSAASVDWAGTDLGPEFAGLTAKEFVDRLAREIARTAD
ncbi:MAG: Chromosomal replication initiator protein DnaA [Phycisphaerales bacterium]|nr:Chromosomal replication initiator protein DnaA [Phycisphaerales bacterium]